MSKKPTVFLVCTGVGHINRGYESFTTECFHAIKDNNNFDLYLLKGGGRSNDTELKINCIQRNSTSAKFYSRIFKKDTYWVEQFTFLINMVPKIIKYKPAVIYYSDFILGTFLWHLRRFWGFKYKLLFANGAPNGPPYITEDHVQLLLPVYMNAAIEAGEPPSKLTLLPYGFDIDIQSRLNGINKKDELRVRLNLPVSKKIILSVGAINLHHKRMDYVIEETSKLSDDYFLVILGQFESETPVLIQMAAEKLPGRHLIINVPYEQVREYYFTSDYFVLASLIEGFGRVIIEALSYGLPCIVNDYANARQVLGEYGLYIDMIRPGALSGILTNDVSKLSQNVLINGAYNNYSWDKLANRYIDMIFKLCN